MLSNNNFSFYKYENGDKLYYSILSEKYEPFLTDDKNITFEAFKKKDSLIKKDWSASVVDLGDGVAGVEFHSVLKKELNPLMAQSYKLLLGS